MPEKQQLWRRGRHILAFLVQVHIYTQRHRKHGKILSDNGRISFLPKGIFQEPIQPCKQFNAFLELPLTLYIVKVNRVDVGIQFVALQELRLQHVPLLLSCVSRRGWASGESGH